MWKLADYRFNKICVTCNAYIYKYSNTQTCCNFGLHFTSSNNHHLTNGNIKIYKLIALVNLSIYNFSVSIESGPSCLLYFFIVCWRRRSASNGRSQQQHQDWHSNSKLKSEREWNKKKFSTETKNKFKLIEFKNCVKCEARKII